MRLSIGTAQFGRDYGVANHNGKIKLDEIKNIFKIAIENNIDTFDTAEDYGNSEEIIGNMTKYLSMDAKIITKAFVKLKDRKFVHRAACKSIFGKWLYRLNLMPSRSHLGVLSK